VVDVATEIGVTTLKLVMVAGGVAALVSESVILSIFSSKLARNWSNIASVCMPLALPELFLDHGVEGEDTDFCNGVEGDICSAMFSLSPPGLKWVEPILDCPKDRGGV
jgi:hypothetical protein